MEKKKLIAVTATGVALLLIVAGAGVYFSKKDQPVSIEAVSTVAGSSASTAAESSASEDDYVPPPIELRVYSSEADTPASVTPDVASSRPEENTITSTPNANGGKDVTVSRPEYSRPPDDETIYDEPKDNGENSPDASQGGNDNGNTPKPEEKPQGGSGGQGGGKPGQVYVPGFGWMDDKPSTGPGEVAENGGTGEVIGQ